MDQRTGHLATSDLALIDAWWRAANYLSVGQIYLMANPLLREPLVPEHIKPRLLGHWGTTPGLNLVYVHASRVVRERDLDAIWIVGPGHGGPAAVANAYLEGSAGEVNPALTLDEAGMQRLFRQFSFPGGIGSHVTPETPGSIHEGGELGYSLVHAFGAAFDNPDLVVFCVIGDGEAETGPLAASWHSNKFLNPATDGTVVPILALNGYKIANPTILDRIGDDELLELLEGYGYAPRIVGGDDPMTVHAAMAETMDAVLDDVASIKAAARDGSVTRPTWPMIVLRTPKGWTGPKVVDGKPTEGTWRSHQVPLAEVRTNPEHLAVLETWLLSYGPEALFDPDGRPRDEILELAPRGDRRMSANPHANGGLFLRDLRLPDFRDYGVEVTAPATTTSEATRVLGTWLRDVVRDNPTIFRVFGPDETSSNRLDALFEVTDRAWMGEIRPTDEHLAPSGRVLEVLSEHLCQGWLEGYLLTGRHGLFNCYEAFIHVINSMFNQHAKWLKMTREIPWRRPIASLNYLLTSHVWRQDHNGFSHQDPGFIDHVVNKKAEVIRVYLPPDANCLLSVADHCLRSQNYVNVIVAGKQPALDFLSMEDAILHCTRGIGIWEWASNDGGSPDVVLACCGDVPTLETVAAAAILRQHLPDLKVRVVNVVDLMRLVDEKEHPHGLTDGEFDALFTTDRPVIFAYHGYPWLIHRLTYRRTNHGNLHVRGYKEEGTVTTPFDMVMRNDLDRYHLVLDVIDRVPGLGSHAASLRQHLEDERLRARAYARQHGEDSPEIPRLALDQLSGDGPAPVRILVLNAGSSNLKASLIEPPGRAPAFERTTDWPDDGPDGAAAAIREVLEASGPIDAIGHRVVHGGERFTRPTRLDDEAIAGIEALSDLAPLHNPLALATIRAARRLLPDVPQVAAFDTAFHATLPESARRYPVPDEWARAGIRRYGFHGLSVTWSVQRASEILERPADTLGVVVAHLGGGCSVTAVEGGRSIDTSMGMTPLEGLMMGTRAGSIDPGIVFHRLRDGQPAEAIESDLDRRSGLVGVAGTADMGELLIREAGGDDRARLAIEMFVRRAAAAIAASATNLSIIDAIVFTGGIGEHAHPVRTRICERLHLVPLDGREREVDGDGWLGATAGPSVLRIAAREDVVIAMQVASAMGGS